MVETGLQLLQIGGKIKIKRPKDISKFIRKEVVRGTYTGRGRRKRYDLESCIACCPLSVRSKTSLPRKVRDDGAF